MAGNQNSGGYRQPSNPAPVSGPGMLSERTDGGAIEGMTPAQPQQQWTGLPYGENKAVNEQQSGAPLAGVAPVSSIPMDLSAPTAFPNEPISHGANWGEGPGLNTAGVRGLRPETTANVIYRAMQNDKSGQLEAIYNRLNMG
jgi:hypothetical protein